jgi:hypothetical protein
MSRDPDLELAPDPLVDALESLGIPYRIGGSIASSLHGVARATLDVDIVVHMPADATGRLADALGKDWYAEPAAMSDAVRRGSSFNVIHLPTMVKIDVFSRGNRAHDRAAFQRLVRERMGERPQAPLVRHGRANVRAPVEGRRGDPPGAAGTPPPSRCRRRRVSGEDRLTWA